MSNEELVEYKKYVDETMHSIFSKINDDEKELLNILIQQFNIQCENINKAIEYMNDTVDFNWENNSPIKNGKSLSLNKLLNILKGNGSNE